MRIALVGNFGLTGKQTMAVRALPLAEALAARGHSVLLALPIRRAGDQNAPPAVGGVRLCLAGRGPRIPGLAHLWQVILLSWFCWRWRPAAIYCFKPIAHSGTVLALFWAMRRLGLFRGILALDADDWEGDGGWNELQPFPGWLKRLISWQEKWALHHADLVTVASRALVELAERAGARRVVYLPNAVADSSPGLADPADPGLRERLGLEGRPVVLLYTRFFEFGLDRLLDSFQGILRGVGDAVLLVVGSGLHGEEADFLRLARSRGVADRVVPVGWVPAEELPDYFHAADVALYPLDDTLLNRAKCPVKLLDLLAAGVPVVADRVGQAAEYVVDGQNGVLVDPGDARAMADAAVSLLRDPARREAMVRSARLDARARWSWELWAPRVEKALGEALTNAHPGPRP